MNNPIKSNYKKFNTFQALEKELFDINSSLNLDIKTILHFNYLSFK